MGSKSTFSNSTSRSYAIALYELSKENSEVEKVEEGLKSLDKLLNENKDFKETILSPTVLKEDKKKVIFAIADKYSFSNILKKFLGYVAIKNRLFFIQKIIESFLNLVSKNRGELKAKLISSKELSEDEKKDIQKELSDDFKSPVTLDCRYDPDLIAGLIIQVGSVMVDTSVKTKLQKLEKRMIEA